MNSINFAGTAYTEKSLAALPGKELVALYNAAAKKQGSAPTKRFSTIGSGLTRTWKILQEVGEVAAPAKPAANVEPSASLGTAVAPKGKGRAKAEKKAEGEARAFRGTNRAAPGHQPLACREGSKQATLLDQLARPEGASMAELVKALSGGKKPWTEATVHSGFGWDMKLKGYGVRSEEVDGVERFFIVLPPKGKIPAHTPLKGAQKSKA